MLTHDARKAAVAAYKEIKPVAGIFALRCQVSARIWVGQTPNLGTIRNRLWFTLRQGANPHREVQAAWATHGEDSFLFEILERLEDEDPGYSLRAALKERCAYWRQTLGAQAI